MPEDRVLLITDVEGSAELTSQLGDSVASSLWMEHDRTTRRLLRQWAGREIDKSDGFLLLFDDVDKAVGFARDMHAAFSELSPPLSTRVGIHRGSMIERENSTDDVALGAKQLELDGLAKVVAARIMTTARGGQTLLSACARQALSDGRWHVRSHGHWRMKGLPEPIELFEAGDDRTEFIPPAGSQKSYQVVRDEDGWKSVEQVRHGLPSERDGFVGRGDALSALADLFDREARLVTVLGIGGIGKTRLALRYARQWLGDYPGGAWFCDISSARSLDGIVHAVAQGLDVPLGNTDPVQQLGTALAGRGPCLVILDNFEQVARHAEATVGQWLERAPQLRLLVTSREVLGIPGEQSFALAPLAKHEAVQLLERRAKGADNAYVLDPSDQATALKLVDLLDCLPLAIELAAARVRVMSLQVMLDRMGERFKLLASFGGRRDRQATLRCALDWSWELLLPHEKSALAQLSAFEGGFTLDAAEAVVALDSAMPAPWLPDVVQSLIQKSLLRRVSPKRFDMLRSVQDYAKERLALSTDADAATAHCRHWIFFSRIEEPGSHGERFEDLDNLVQAFRRAIAARQWDDGVTLLALAADALMMTGPASAVIDLAQALRDGPELSDVQQATVARAMGNAHHMLGQTGRAHALFLEGLEHAIRGGDIALQVRLRCAVAETLARSGDHESALGQLHHAMATIAAQQDGALSYTVLNRLGVVLLERGKCAEAATHLQNALATARSLHHRRWEGGSLGNLGLAMYGLGKLQEAAECFRDAAAIGLSVGDRQWSANAQCNLAFLFYEEGRHAEAEREFNSVLLIARDIGHPTLESTVLCNLGLTLFAQARFSEAAGRLDAAASLAAAIGDRRLHAECLRHLALAWARLGRLTEAVQQAAAAAELAGQLRSDVEVILALCVQAEVQGLASERDRALGSLDQAKLLLTRANPSTTAATASTVDRIAQLLGRTTTP